MFDAEPAGEPAGQRHHDRSADDIGGQRPGDLVQRGRQASLDVRQATLRIVLSTPCMMFASMIEIVIMPRFGTGANVSPLTADAPRAASAAHPLAASYPSPNLTRGARGEDWGECLSGLRPILGRARSPTHSRALGWSKNRQPHGIGRPLRWRTLW